MRFRPIFTHFWGRESSVQFRIFLLSLALVLAPGLANINIPPQCINSIDPIASTRYFAPLLTYWQESLPLLSSPNGSLEAPVVELSVSSSPNYTGSIVVIWASQWFGQLLEAQLGALRDQGALAVLLGTSYAVPGRAGYILLEIEKRLPGYFGRLAVFQASEDGARVALFNDIREGRVQCLAIDGIDLYNPWRELPESALYSVLFHAGLILPSLFCFVFAAVKLRFFVMKQGIIINIPQSILFLQVIENFLRVFFGATDPTGVHSIFPWFPAAFFPTTSFPFSVATSLLILFHWNHAINPFGAKSIKWMLKPILVAIGFAFVGEIIASTVRGFDLGTTAFLIVQVLYIILQLFVAGYLIYTLTNVYNLLQFPSQQERSVKKGVREKALRMAKILIALVVFIFLTIILATFFIFVAESPAGEFSWYVAIGVNLCCVSFLKILIFKAAKPKLVISASGSSRSKTTSARTIDSSLPSPLPPSTPYTLREAEIEVVREGEGERESGEGKSREAEEDSEASSMSSSSSLSPSSSSIPPSSASITPRF